MDDDRPAAKRPWYHLHFGPWCLLILGFALYLYAVVTIQNSIDAEFEFLVALCLGSACLLGAAFLEAKYQHEEDLQKDRKEYGRLR